MSTAFPSVFRIMGTGQRDVPCNGREEFPEHPYPEGGITGHYIFNPVRILVELQADVPYRVIFVGKRYPLPHPVYEVSTQGILIGGA